MFGGTAGFWGMNEGWIEHKSVLGNDSNKAGHRDRTAASGISVSN